MKVENHPEQSAAGEKPPSKKKSLDEARDFELFRRRIAFAPHSAIERAEAHAQMQRLLRSNKALAKRSEAWTGATLLMLAARAGRREAVKLLAPHSDLDARDGEGNAALHYAGISGNKDLIMELASRHAASPVNNSGQNALMRALAASQWNPATLDALASVCDPQQADAEGRTALMLAACNGRCDLETLRALCAWCDPKNLNAQGESALSMAMACRSSPGSAFGVLWEALGPRSREVQAPAAFNALQARQDVGDREKWPALDELSGFVRLNSAKEAFKQGGREKMPKHAARVEAVELAAVVKKAGRESSVNGVAQQQSLAPSDRRL